MRVFIIARGYPTEIHITNGIFEFDQAKALASMGHEVIYIAIDTRSIRKKRRLGVVSLLKDNVHIEAINIPVSNFSEKLLYFTREKSLKYMFEKCSEKYGKPDIIHAHFLPFAYITAKVLNGQGIPLIVTEHLSKLNDDTIDSSIMKYGLECYKHFDKVIAVGTRLAASLKKNFDIDARIIPNIVDTDSYQFDPSYKTNKNEFNIVSVGSLIPRKNMGLLIDAFSRFYNEHPNSSLKIFGRGPEHENLMQKIAEQKLEKIVSLEGRKPRTEIAQSMRDASCFALASTVETFGVVYIEAMTMGLPVIATRSNGPEDFVNDQCGVVIEPNDADILYQAMCEIYDKKSEYNSVVIHDYVIENFSPKSIAKKIEEVYLEARGIKA